MTIAAVSQATSFNPYAVGLKSPAQIRGQIGELEREEDSHPTAQIEQELLQLEQAQQEQMQQQASLVGGQLNAQA